MKQATAQECMRLLVYKIWARLPRARNCPEQDRNAMQSHAPVEAGSPH